MNNLARDVEHLMLDGFEGGAVIRDRQDEFFEPRHQSEKLINHFPQLAQQGGLRIIKATTSFRLSALVTR